MSLVIKGCPLKLIDFGVDMSLNFFIAIVKNMCASTFEILVLLHVINKGTYQHASSQSDQ